MNIASSATITKPAWIGLRNTLMNLATLKTILRTYVFERQTIIEVSQGGSVESRDVHFFLDIQINPPYKGDTSACSHEWRVL